ncbi:hypothetical protein RSOL_064830, partial [Rhizoctonia solani AG-3 Rhs1AP]
MPARSSALSTCVDLRDGEDSDVVENNMKVERVDDLDNTFIFFLHSTTPPRTSRTPKLFIAPPPTLASMLRFIYPETAEDIDMVFGPRSTANGTNVPIMEQKDLTPGQVVTLYRGVRLTELLHGHDGGWDNHGTHQHNNRPFLF